jgi:hypothetical protein
VWFAIPPLYMTKHDWIWIAIRVFGIYLLVEALLAIPGLVSSAFSIYEFYPIIHSGSAGLDRVPQTVLSSVASQLVNSATRLFICGAVGVYLVKGGSSFFRILCPPDSETK